MTVKVTINAPNQKNTNFAGQIKIVNKQDPNDYEIIDVSLKTPKNKDIFRLPLIQKFQEIFTNIFSFLMKLLGLLK